MAHDQRPASPSIQQNQKIVWSSEYQKTADVIKQALAGAETQHRMNSVIIDADSADREELIARLQDPILTIDEAALLLNTDQKTIRRYSNSGALEHVKAYGGQRKYRLSQLISLARTSGSRG